jgi:actin-related protein
MRRKLISFGKQHKDFPGLTVSFLTRAKGMEVCFGDPEADQPSIAASALRSLKALNVNTRVLVAQNIIVAGGSCMVPGFKVRLI